MRKNNNSKILIVLLICIALVMSYLWWFSPFLPHINRNADESFIYNNMTYSRYSEPDFMKKFQDIKRGKKIAIIKKQGDLPRCSVYKAVGKNSDNILIVYEEIIMSIDDYYIGK